MLTAYFDEAIDTGFTVVCGWVADVAQWENFEVDWKLFLIKHDIPYFHMKEFAQSVGPFSKWKGSETVRKQFLVDAWDIISSRVRRGFVCTVHDELFDSINTSHRLIESFRSCYALAGRETMDWANRYANAMRLPVKCVFEDGGPDKGGLLSTADIAPMVSSPDFEPSRDIQDRKKGMRRGVVQLQAADYLAYEIRKYIVDHPLYKSGQRIPRASLRQFGQKAPDTKFMTEERMLRACQWFGIDSRIEARSAKA
jgi:hypothetical protein